MKFEIFHKGKRYWAHRMRLYDGRSRYNFWSSHKWPFYHGSITTADREEAYRAFLSWLPFKPKNSLLEKNHS